MAGARFYLIKGLVREDVHKNLGKLWRRVALKHKYDEVSGYRAEEMCYRFS